MVKNGIVKECASCGKEYYVPGYRKNISKFCSIDCKNHKQYEHITKICKICGLQYEVSKSRKDRIYCSEKCRFKDHLDSKEIRKRQRLCVASSRGYRSKYLRKLVLEKYNHACMVCGYKEYDFCLDVHHIDKNPNNNEHNNLALLCGICHRKLHKGVINLDNFKSKKQAVAIAMSNAGKSKKK